MKVNIQFVDTKGFIHFQSAEKDKLIEMLSMLHKDTVVKWLSKNEIFISQQYVKGHKT